jgi:hypothetical protein
MSGVGMAMSEAKSGVGHERTDESFSGGSLGRPLDPSALTSTRGGSQRAR